MREQIQQYHIELTKKRINGEIQNNELIYCGGKARMRALVDGEWKEVIMSLDADNTAAIDKMNKIISRRIKPDATKNT